MSVSKFALTAVALAASSISFAQTADNSGSQVNLYGVIDANVQVLSGATNTTRTQSGGLQDSRIGLRGSEDLGNGLRAFFTLESGINLDDGSNSQGTFWGRQAYVGLSSPYGTVSLGRQYGSIYKLSNDFSEFGNVASGASTAVIGGFGGYEPVRGASTSSSSNGGPVRLDNSVKYETPDYLGFKAGAVVSLGEQSGDTNGTRVGDVYASYSKNGLDATLSYVTDKKADTGLDVQTTSAAAGYRFGNYHVVAGVISVDDRSATDIDGRGYWIGGDYRLGAHTFKAQYVENKLTSNGDGKTQALGVGYQYDLSKRTALYSSLTRFKNEGSTTNYAYRAAGTLPTGLITDSDRNITEFSAGIRVSF
jgi:predicted porin